MCMARLADEVWGDEGEPRRIAARSRQARHETVRYRVADTNENNREGRRRFLGGQGGRGASASHDDINLERGQFRRESGQPLGLRLGISVLDQDVLPFDVTEVTQSLEEGLSVAGVRRQVARQVAYPSDLGRLLRLGRERRKNETDSENYREPDQPHAHLGWNGWRESS